MAETHHSIGEVLSLLKEEHPDLTISKIRFFESQGLIAPDRTPSGYRKFAEPDIERLRWILVQQRDHFLPLKVIKRRLEEGGFDPDAPPPAPADAPLPEPTLFSRKEDEDDADAADGSDAEADEAEVADAALEAAAADDETAPEPAAAGDAAGSDEPTSEDVDVADGPAAESAPGPDRGGGPAAAAPVVPTAEPAPPIGEGDPLRALPGSVSLTVSELADAAGVDGAFVGDLERLGLIARVGGDDGSFDHEALVVTKAAAVFAARGVEPRHLRMYRVAADREAGLLEQLMAAKLRKGGEMAATARAELNELVGLGETIHRSIVRRSFGPHLD